MNNDNNAIPISHITGEPNPDGTVTTLCGLTYKPEGYIDEQADRYVTCALCEAAYELRDVPPWDVRDGSARPLSDLFTKLIREMCEAGGLSGSQLAKQAEIPRSTFYRRMSGRSSWTFDELHRIGDVLGGFDKLLDIVAIEMAESK